MLFMMAGGEKMARTPFVSNSNCFVVPPMKFATESCKVMEECIKGGMPVLLLSAGQVGATAPAPIAGAIVQAVAECLAGLVYEFNSPRLPSDFWNMALRVRFKNRSDVGWKRRTGLT